MKLEERFSKYIKKEKQCWRWTGASRGNGYGCLKVKGRVIDSHRVSWLIYRGEIKKGHIICHRCNNRWCANPKHLYQGTYKSNVKDSIRDGTHHLPPVGTVYGERHPRSKLNYKKADEIKKSGLSQRKLAKKYGVHRSTIRAVLYGETWRNVN